MRITSHTVVATHTAWVNARRPGTCSGNVTPAVATMPVPMTDANQFGHRKLRSRCRSVVAMPSSSRPARAAVTHYGGFPPAGSRENAVSQVACGPSVECMVAVTDTRPDATPAPAAVDGEASAPARNSAGVRTASLLTGAAIATVWFWIPLAILIIGISSIPSGIGFALSVVVFVYLMRGVEHV